MTKIGIAILAACLLTVATPFAAADDTKADCEENQPWIGYTSTTAVGAAVEGVLGPEGDAIVCEGEHWDGQDSVYSEDNTGRDPSCTDNNLGEANPEKVFVTSCQPSDPNNGSPGVGLNAVGVRVSFAQSSGVQQAYVATDIFTVGKAIIYVGHCDGSGAGLEGATACGGSQQGRLGVYVQDNTNQMLPANVLATLVSAPGITQGYVAESDCSQETYQKGAEERNRELCGRDNTAITADLIGLP